MGVLEEAQLLKFQANYYKTYFVSTKKLSHAPINEALLRLVPLKLASKLCVFPVKYDQRSGELSVLTAQPDDLDVLKNVQFATRVPKIRALVARPAAIEAAILVHYRDEFNAFSTLLRGGAIDLRKHLEHHVAARIVCERRYVAVDVLRDLQIPAKIVGQPLG